MNLDDSVVGEALRQLREEAGLSQAEFAERLTGAGMPTHQQTVLKIEKGQRSLRMTEAVVIASVLRVELADLVTPGGSLERAASSVVAAEMSVRRAVDQFGHARARLLRQVRAVKSAAEAEPPGVQLDLESTAVKPVLAALERSHDFFEGTIARIYGLTLEAKEIPGEDAREWLRSVLGEEELEDGWVYGFYKEAP